MTYKERAWRSESKGITKEMNFFVTNLKHTDCCRIYRQTQGFVTFFSESILPNQITHWYYYNQSKASTNELVSSSFCQPISFLSIKENKWSHNTKKVPLLLQILWALFAIWLFLGFQTIKQLFGQRLVKFRPHHNF